MTADEALTVITKQLKENNELIASLIAENKSLRKKLDQRTDEPEPCYSVRKVAELLSVSEQTVRRMIENNKIRAVAVSGADGRNCRKVIPKSAYINYLKGGAN